MNFKINQGIALGVSAVSSNLKHDILMIFHFKPWSQIIRQNKKWSVGCHIFPGLINNDCQLIKLQSC